ncbi:MAG: SUMF1/EgtB/PvdO family nonheme iron enzyme, partial [Bacteroidota bacterium]
NISHEGAEAYCQWLTELYNEVNKMSAWRVEVRLPSKGEWMYAAQGGHQLAYYPWGSNHVRNAKGCYLGNFKQIDESKLIFDSKNNTFAMADSSVTMSGKSLNGKYKYIDGQGLAMASAYFPNNYGLYNMSGNAAEMLQEKGSTKGGSWSSTGYHVRIDAADEYAGWEESNPYIGFRPIIVVKKKK